MVPLGALPDFPFEECALALLAAPLSTLFLLPWLGRLEEPLLLDVEGAMGHERTKWFSEPQPKHLFSLAQSSRSSSVLEVALGLSTSLVDPPPPAPPLDPRPLDDFLPPVGLLPPLPLARFTSFALLPRPPPWLEVAGLCPTGPSLAILIRNVQPDCK